MKNGMDVLKQADRVGMTADQVTQFAMAAKKKNSGVSIDDMDSEQVPVIQPNGEKTRLAEAYLRNQQQQRALKKLPAWMDITHTSLSDAKYHVNALHFYVKLLGVGLLLVLCLLLAMMWLILEYV